MPVSKHTTLATELEKDILSGKYGWEGGLPTTSELAQTWNMSINTVKNALALLEGKDLIEKRGIAYYVNRVPTVMTQYVPPAHSRYHRPGYCKNIGPVKRIALPAHLAEKVNTSSSELTVYRMQVSGEVAEGNERPLQLSYRYHILPVSDEKIKQMENNAAYDPMWTEPEQGTELWSHDEITPRLATEGERDLLNLPESTPVTSVFEVIRDKDNKLLMLQEIVLSSRTTLIFDFPFTNRPAESS
jgi:DNA-binding GntR family transcriptional regulator